MRLCVTRKWARRHPVYGSTVTSLVKAWWRELPFSVRASKLPTQKTCVAFFLARVSRNDGATFFRVSGQFIPRLGINCLVSKLSFRAWTHTLTVLSLADCTQMSSRHSWDSIEQISIFTLKHRGEVRWEEKLEVTRHLFRSARHQLYTFRISMKRGSLQ